VNEGVNITLGARGEAKNVPLGANVELLFKVTFFVNAFRAVRSFSEAPINKIFVRTKAGGGQNFRHALCPL
jgi:hypothetical protein